MKRETIFIGTVLHRLRRQRLLSQEELAFRSGIERNYLSDLENDKSEPGLGVVFALAEALDINPEDFVAMINKHIKG
ncbi:MULTISPECIES: helix-turn-helix domain-containing protein [unclassified Bacillus (in: firmicutes)]|uniref:helix-turn-helix domain-containing protein n=1 Tax=unclassified Bacillus (in: firmicutes) TaxID=185979 RepID=UPI0008EF7956|nr:MULTISPECIES: helix-turn-helix transcriptional regulator [unclassified Bacillus (in: firmicutes)]SFB04797.1 Helix-turn-helix [Bacillus sp. UNCCL13]SFQ88393.1 Helix-turn-helix [Bacillus sp. cl95]